VDLLLLMNQMCLFHLMDLSNQWSLLYLWPLILADREAMMVHVDTRTDPDDIHMD
jgi:hypothetical protein